MKTIDHSTLPSIENAKLPQAYENARLALSECSRIDECQSWADKAEALASYAKQSNDDSLRKMADRIQARAIRRSNELLKQFPESKGGPRKDNLAGTGQVSRSQAAEESGMSRRQYRTAMDVGKVPAAQFESLVESDNPPTVTKLAEQGRRQIIDLKGRDPKEFNRSLHFVAAFRWHLKALQEYDIDGMTKILTEDERSELKSFINGIDPIHDQIMMRV